MEIQVITFISWLLFLQMGPSLTSPQIQMQMWTTVGASVIMPCNINTNGDFTWKKNGVTYARRLNSQINYGSLAESSRISFPHETKLKNYSMQLVNIKLNDFGKYYCDEKLIINLVIFDISVSPSTNLIASENLNLSINSAPENMMGLRITWETPRRGKIEDKRGITVANVQINDGGTYNCHLWIDGENKATFSRHISVSGFYPSSEIIYISEDSPALIPWVFNFNVRETAVRNKISAVSGSISYSNDKSSSPSLVSSLTVDSGGACWPERCAESKKEQPDNLSFHHLKPKAGWYHLEIQLEQEKRKTKLAMDVCLVKLTVSDVPRQLLMEAVVTLTCQASCANDNSTLYWHHENSNTVKHGQRGKPVVSWAITAVPEFMGVWICSVRIGGKIMLSTNVTLELEATFLKSQSLVWMLVGGGHPALVGMVTIVILAARCRRKRRARRGAWILMNLDQQRRCQCKGFAPMRLREKD
ncbi:cd4 receptor S homeolog precursor [Xenopus laevis]|uniref:CD4 receptor n=1 Tax=Xenopus laevis TaxID=8355 RepID=E9LP47_XENLA|nr:cd4 receptor S homeolog precursor [Xenopus laevis]ADV71259.1 CD4 receptor [Xenopus laevis]